MNLVCQLKMLLCSVFSFKFIQVLIFPVVIALILTLEIRNLLYLFSSLTYERVVLPVLIMPLLIHICERNQTLNRDR